jgi:hypothetical protein
LKAKHHSERFTASDIGLGLQASGLGLVKLVSVATLVKKVIFIDIETTKVTQGSNSFGKITLNSL